MLRDTSASIWKQVSQKITMTSGLVYPVQLNNLFVLPISGAMRAHSHSWWNCYIFGAFCSDRSQDLVQLACRARMPCWKAQQALAKPSVYCAQPLPGESPLIQRLDQPRKCFKSYSILFSSPLSSWATKRSAKLYRMDMRHKSDPEKAIGRLHNDPGKAARGGRG